MVLRIPVGEFDDRQLSRLAAASFFKAGYDPDEPRLPKGDPHGGEWTVNGDNEAAGPSASISPHAAFGVSVGEGGSPIASDIGASPSGDAKPDGGASAGDVAANTELAQAGDITWRHGSRHLDDPGDAADVEAAISVTLAVAPFVPGFNSGAVNVNGKWYIYRAFLRPNGSINVGTYFPW